MGELVAAEFLKLRTTRAFWIIVAITFVLMGLIALGFSAATDLESDDDLRFSLSTEGGGIMALILAVVGTAGEYRHNTITAAFLVTAERWRVVAAKVLAYALAGIALGLLSQLLVGAIVAIWYLAADAPSALPERDALELLVGSAGYWAFMAVLGVGLGLLMKNQAAAIVLALVVLFVVQPTIAALEPDVAKFLPTAVGSAFAQTSDPGDTELLASGTAIAVAFVYVALTSGAAAYVLDRRDVT